MERNIELDQLQSFFQEFTERNLYRPTRLEIFDEMGAQTEEQGLPLRGIDLDMKGSGSPRVEIMLGGQIPEQRHLTHTVTNVRRVYVKIGEGNIDEVLEIESQGGGKTLLHLEALDEIPAA